MGAIGRRRVMQGAALAGLLPAGRLSAQERAAVEAGARKEGALAFATSVTVPDFPRFLAGFTAKYPFLEVNSGLYQAATAPVLARVDAELKSGAPRFDVFHLANPAAYLTYAAQGLLQPYDSPEMAAYPPAARGGNLWTTARAVGVMLAYNRNILPPDQAPAGWRDLLKPAFKGRKLVIQNAASGTWLMAVYVLEKALGPEYFRQMAAQGLILTTGSAQQIDMLARGEALVAAGIDHTVMFTDTVKRAGIVPVYPAEGMPVSAAPIAILKGAPHPNAARLFIDYVLSREGQELFVNQVTRNYSMRPDVPTPPEQRPLAEVKPLTPTDWEDYLRFAPTFPQHYDRLFKA